MEYSSANPLTKTLHLVELVCSMLGSEEDAERLEHRDSRRTHSLAIVDDVLEHLDMVEGIALERIVGKFHPTYMNHIS